ncbi:MAG TPA: transcription initiation factor IIB [Candidatus Lokiarchaeia archaeon]|nr:transcription initiation factor IIB [Candidatus Lokiarchaeia archaeon]
MVVNLGENNIWKDIESENETCKNCGAIAFVVDDVRGEKACSGCGLVIKSRIVDPGPEWRAFDADQINKRTRAGPPPTFTVHDKGLSTIIDFRDRDVFGRKLSPYNKILIYRLRRWQRRARCSDTTERTLIFALSELDRMASALSLPKHSRETASKLYRTALKKHLIRGRSIEGIVAASIYVSCRLHKIPRALQEIADVARVGKKDIGSCYRFLSTRLALNTTPTSSTDYIARFASGLRFSAKCQSTACHILQIASKKGLTSGRGPGGIAAAALYLAGVLENERRTQREIAKIARVTEVTVRNRLKELILKLDIHIQA